MRHRVLANVGIAALVVLAPWWAAVSLAVALSFLARPFYELLAWALLFDVLYAVPSPEWFSFPFPLAFAACVFVIFAEQVKARMRFYA